MQLIIVVVVGTNATPKHACHTHKFTQFTTNARTLSYPLSSWALLSYRRCDVEMTGKYAMRLHLIYSMPSYDAVLLGCWANGRVWVSVCLSPAISCWMATWQRTAKLPIMCPRVWVCENASDPFMRAHIEWDMSGMCEKRHLDRYPAFRLNRPCASAVSAVLGVYVIVHPHNTQCSGIMMMMLLCCTCVGHTPESRAVCACLFVCVLCLLLVMCLIGALLVFRSTNSREIRSNGCV